MKIFDEFKSKSLEELADWFDKYCVVDDAPWFNWYDRKYCDNCETVILEDNEGREMEYSWCELNNKCRFFQEMNDTPSIKQTIEMWLNSEIN